VVDGEGIVALTGKDCRVALACLLACCAALGSAPAGAEAAPLDRPDDPIVLTGSDVAALQGIAPSDLVAFRWQGSWDQIPVQVDERRLIDINDAYGAGYTCSGNSLCYTRPPFGVTYVNYTDPKTWIGPDTDATVDANDEIALMAKDAGARLTGAPYPPGVAGRAVEVKITDPLDGGEGYAYLFEQDGSLDPGGGAQYVDYNFNLTSGNYKATYKLNGGSAPNLGNPETSTVVTPNYQRGFTDRWTDNDIRITRGSATGVDILDRHDDQLLSGEANCGRHQESFRNGEGAFIVNKSGPVRAIRDFIGANSGPQVQRQHIFYESREDINTFLRVHPIPGLIDFFDYSPAASGMVRRDPSNASPGQTVDGVPDPGWVSRSGTSGQEYWETMDGPQGGISMVHEYVTNNADPTYATSYADDTSPPSVCGGDAFLYGSSGPRSGSMIYSTDQAYGGTTRLFARRTLYYEAPGQTNGPARLQDDANRLALSVTNLPEGYVRPKSASPIEVSLVPAFSACATPNRVHGPPLAFGSCSPPAQRSSVVTIGAPDPNGPPVRSESFATLTAIVGNPSTGTDEANVGVKVSATDVRESATLADYTGDGLQLRFNLIVTDRHNGSPATQAATGGLTSWQIPLSCTATAGAEGANCGVTTTLESIVPGAVTEGKRAVWEVRRIDVRDANGDSFLQQGVFVP